LGFGLRSILPSLQASTGQIKKNNANQAGEENGW
jgi:hypothetical protein